MQKIPVPPKEVLLDFLYNKMMSKKKIAGYFVVSKTTGSAWMKNYNITGTLPPELLEEKRSRTNLKKSQAKEYLERTLKGEDIVVQGFNSEFAEDYLMEETYENEKALEAFYAERQARRKAKEEKRKKRQQYEEI